MYICHSTKLLPMLLLLEHLRLPGEGEPEEMEGTPLPGCSLPNNHNNTYTHYGY